MAKVLISEKYLYDIANAIRAKLDSQSSYTPAQMAAAIASIDGTISGSITPSTNTGKGVITDSNLTAIADAIRAKLDVETLYTPAQMAAAILSIEASTPTPTIVSWASGSDADVAAMIDAAQAGTIDLQQDGGWAVGDVRTITVGSYTDSTGNTRAAQQIDIVIVSFDEYMSCGNVLQFDFKDSLVNICGMNATSTNVGGYGSSAMKTVTLPAVANAMPDWIKTRLIEFSVLASAGNGSSTIDTVTGNKLALRSEIEAYGSVVNSVPGEGTHVGYYRNSGDRKKKLGHTGSNYDWWLRSPYSTQRFCRITSYGIPNNDAAQYGYGVAPFGCL